MPFSSHRPVRAGERCSHLRRRSRLKRAGEAQSAQRILDSGFEIAHGWVDADDPVGVRLTHVEGDLAWFYYGEYTGVEIYDCWPETDEDENTGWYRASDGYHECHTWYCGGCGLSNGYSDQHYVNFQNGSFCWPWDTYVYTDLGGVYGDNVGNYGPDYSIWFDGCASEYIHADIGASAP